MSTTGKLAVILSGFPRRSETFALNELIALQDDGLLGPVFATKPGDPASLQPEHAPLLDRVEVLPAGSTDEQAAHIARLLAAQGMPVGIHGYFAHEPALVAYLAARRLGIPHGFSVHARDARKASADALRERARDAACVIACNRDVADDIGRLGIASQLIPHGVDVERFTPRPAPPPLPPRLLAVGRLVEKKGFDVLVRAVALLDLPLRLRIVGDGPQCPALRAAIWNLGLTDRVTLCGALSHAEVRDELEAAHLVVVPSIVDSSGDRDGLPNVVLEAMASGRAVVASDVAAIASAVEHEQTGLLVPPGDEVVLAQALGRLALHVTLRQRMGACGRRRVEADFDLQRCTARLIDVLRTAYA